MRKAVLEIGIDGNVDRRADRGEMIADVVDGDAVVGLADGPGKARAGGGQRLEAEMLQRLGAADIERIGDDEAAALVQLLERGALVSSCQHGLSPKLFVGAANIVRNAYTARRSRHHLAQKGALFREDEFVLLGEI